MTFLDWVPAISTSAVSTAILACLGYVGKTAAEHAIGHRYEAKIEVLKSELRLSEAKVRDELKARDDQIAALRDSALANLGGSTATLDKRRIEAAERLWEAVIQLLPYRNLAHMTKSLDFDHALTIAAKNDSDGIKARQFADVVWKTSNIELSRKDYRGPDKDRPFVTPLAWARFSAYRNAVMYPAVQLQLMKAGVDSSFLADPKPLLDAVKGILPHLTTFVDELGTASLPYIIDDIESAVLEEVMNITSNGPTDELHITRAAKILASVNAYEAQNSAKAPEPPIAAMRKEYGVLHHNEAGALQMPVASSGLNPSQRG